MSRVFDESPFDPKIANCETRATEEARCLMSFNNQFAQIY